MKSIFFYALRITALAPWRWWARVTAEATCSSSVFLGLVFLIFLMTLPHRTFVEFRPGEFAGQSSTVIPWLANHLVVVQALWAGAKSCWTKKWTSPWSLSSDPGTQLRWLWTKSSSSSWWHGILNHTVETSHWTSSVLFDSWMLISKWNATFSLIWKEDFGLSFFISHEYRIHKIHLFELNYVKKKSQYSVCLSIDRWVHIVYMGHLPFE